MRNILAVVLLMFIFFGCNEKKLFTANECQKETLYLLNCVKEGDYKAFYNSVNQYERIKKRDVSTSYLQEEFNSLGQFLKDKNLSELKIVTTEDPSIKTDRLGALYIDVFYKSSENDVLIYAAKYSFGDTGEYFELDQFINKLENHKTKAVDFMPSPSGK